MNEKIAALKQQLSGSVAPAMVTPLQADGVTVNTAVIPTLVDFLIERGVSGLFVAGTTGEGILLDIAQRQRLAAATATAVNGRVPLILHIGANRTDHTLTLARHAAKLNVAAIAAVTPFFYGLDDDGLAAYYQEIAQVVPGTSLLLYDIPHMAINGIGPALLARLATAIPSLAGVKTSRPDAQAVRQLLAAAPDHLVILAGNERVALALLALGADGLISGLSTAVPEPFVALTHAVTSGNLSGARQIQTHINRLLAVLPAGARIGAIKQILAARGVPAGPPVPPRPMPETAVWPALQAILESESYASTSV